MLTVAIRTLSIQLENSSSEASECGEHAMVPRKTSSSPCLASLADMTKGGDEGVCDSDGDKGKCLIRRQRRIRLRVMPNHEVSGRLGNITSAREAFKRQFDGRRGEAGVSRSFFAQVNCVEGRNGARQCDRQRGEVSQRSLASRSRKASDDSERARGISELTARKLYVPHADRRKWCDCTLGNMCRCPF